MNTDSPDFDGPPQPFDNDDSYDVPELPNNLLPSGASEWINDVSSRLGTPNEAVSMPFLSSLGAVIGTGAKIYPKRNDKGWWEYATNWGASIGNPSTLKTPAIQAGTMFIREEDKALRTAQQTQIQSNAAKIDLLKAHREKLLRAGKDAKTDVDQFAAEREIQQVDTQLRELTKEQERLVINDSTIEAVMKMMGGSPRGLFLLKDEFSGLLTSFDKPGHETDRQAYIESWSGKNAQAIDRIGRGSLYVDKSLLTIYGGIQPSEIAPLVRGASSGSKADGLLQRISLMIYPSPQHFHIGVDKAADNVAEERVRSGFHFVCMNFQRLATTDSALSLNFSVEAQDLFDKWFADHYRKVESYGSNEAMKSHLAKYRKAVPALALAFEIWKCAQSESLPVEVNKPALLLACAWGDYLELHARKVYYMFADSDPSGSALLFQLIKSGKLEDRTTVRDLQRAYPTKFVTSKSLNSALDVLRLKNWIRFEESRGPRGRGSRMIRINPLAMGESQNVTI